MDVKQIIKEIEGLSNRKRKSVSFAESEIYNDNIYPYVSRYLQNFYDKDTLNEVSIYSSINLAKRIVDQEASLYRTAPTRSFSGLSDDQVATIKQVYNDLKIDHVMLRSNRAFKLQGQNHIEVLPFNGKLIARVLLNHHLDAIPVEENPEVAEGYVVSGFDRYQVVDSTDIKNQRIADFADYKSTLKRYAFFTKDSNFIVDGNGELLSDSTENPIGMLPIVEVAGFKDFTYWVEKGTSVTDFTIQFNATMSDIAHIVRMQGFAQAYISGASDMLPERLVIGPNHVLRLPVDPNNPVQTQFGFANPSPDLAGSLRFPEVLLSSFLTSRGLSPKLVSGSGEVDKYTSGLDRLLSMIERFEASQYDMELFRSAEKNLFKLIIRYLNTYAGTSVLSYKWNNVKEDSVDIFVKYSEPQMLMSEQEKLDAIARKKELGLMSDLDAIMEYYGLDEEAARAKLNKMRSEMILSQVTNEG